MYSTENYLKLHILSSNLKYNSTNIRIVITICWYYEDLSLLLAIQANACHT